MHENQLIKTIEENLKAQKNEAEKASPGELDKKWAFLTKTQPERFINKDLTINKESLRNFLKLQLFIWDSPNAFSFPRNPLKYLIYPLSGARRGAIKFLKEHYYILEKNGCIELLKKYPISRVGNPAVFKYKGCEFTSRWARHIYNLYLFNKVFGKAIKMDFINMDIGSSYGIFSNLLKKEYPRSHQVLLDFPEQLVLAHYYLGMIFPEAKIASYKDLIDAKEINRKYIEKYDFVLIPWFMYKNVNSYSLDMLSNFASLGEMRREWFNYYLKSEPFLSTKYFFIHNRFQSYPEYDNDLTILDYPLKEFNTLHFGICPVQFFYMYNAKYIFFYWKKLVSSQYFEFIGERK
jgi:putative sugar O-methyltransferase